MSSSEANSNTIPWHMPAKALLHQCFDTEFWHFYLFLISCGDQSCDPNIQGKVNIDDVLYKPNQTQFFCWFRKRLLQVYEYNISVFTSFCAFGFSLFGKSFLSLWSKCMNTNTCILHWQRQLSLIIVISIITVPPCSYLSKQCQCNHDGFLLKYACCSASISICDCNYYLPVYWNSILRLCLIIFSSLIQMDWSLIFSQSGRRYRACNSERTLELEACSQQLHWQVASGTATGNGNRIISPTGTPYASRRRPSSTWTGSLERRPWSGEQCSLRGRRRFTTAREPEPHPSLKGKRTAGNRWMRLGGNRSRPLTRNRASGPTMTDSESVTAPGPGPGGQRTFA